MKIQTIIPAENILEKQNLRSCLKSFLKLNLRWLNRFFGSQILLELPENMQNLNPDLYSAIDTASKLKNLGIIKSIQKKPKFPDAPFAHIYFAKTKNGHVWGKDLLDGKGAFWSCLAEAAERYLWFNSNEFYKNRVVQTSFENLRDKALNIFSLAGFSQEQKERHECLAAGPKDIFGWVPVRSLTQNKKIFCPVQLISGHYFNRQVRTPHAPEKPEKMLRWGMSTGLATGQSLEEALAKGILEVIERDAFMITYLNKLSPPKIDLESLFEQDKELEKILGSFRRYNLEVYLLQLPTDFSVNTVFSALVDRTGVGPTLSVGARAGFDLKRDILDALAESLMIFSSLTNHLNKKKDLPKLADPVNRLLRWSKPEQLPEIEFLMKGEKVNVDLSKERSFYEFPDDDVSRRKYYRKKLDFLVNELKKKKYEACYAELTTPEIEKLGLRCVNVVIPEPQPMHLIESIPYFGGKRLREVPLKLGYEPAEELNKEPHPFP